MSELAPKAPTDIVENSGMANSIRPDVTQTDLKELFVGDGQMVLKLGMQELVDDDQRKEKDCEKHKEDDEYSEPCKNRAHKTVNISCNLCIAFEHEGMKFHL